MKLKNLNHIYSLGTSYEKKALDNINLEISHNDFIGIIGQTGSGKTTLVKHLNGLMKPTSGMVLFNNKNIWVDFKDIREIRFKIGMVFQYPEYQLFEENVKKDIEYGLKNMKLSQTDISERIEEVINIVGLEKKILQKSPFELSGGEKRRVAIAGVLAMRPEILILDEPTAGLDPEGCHNILDGISRYRKERNATVLLISHNMEDIAAYAEKVLVMHNSKIIMYDSVERVFSQSKELLKLGLNVPMITQISMLLNKGGFNISPYSVSVQETVEQILKVLDKKKEVG
ncbi:energy-coupling factor transporter ATPase [Mediterraneibacter gnavus]|uniref:Energy-coupling factor transporter ATP-binding protein EcfA2 n=1 Tax=Mediterraneibacter gnavus TaxID=33038 RepID=A0A415S9K4_MEDGN|nr:energy-coupling factor transporter ATPase [Mediterraneibacter gnavus]RHM75915.1 energy-coupling factor transporter ATPase [Mediterraneibacter gnavus]